jgi:hypothetical protein
MCVQMMLEKFEYFDTTESLRLFVIFPSHGQGHVWELGTARWPCRLILTTVSRSYNIGFVDVSFLYVYMHVCMRVCIHACITLPTRSCSYNIMISFVVDKSFKRLCFWHLYVYMHVCMRVCMHAWMRVWGCLVVLQSHPHDSESQLQYRFWRHGFRVQVTLWPVFAFF